MTKPSLSAGPEEATRRSTYHEADAVIVGAGVFGCAMAYALARQGRSVLLLERRMMEPDRIVGELLQPGGIESLRKLGLSQCLENIDAIPCYGYDVIYKGQSVLLPYPPLNENGTVISDEDAWSPLDTKPYVDSKFRRPEGRGFHHGRFIMQLRRACASHENITIVETEVTKAIRGEHTDQILGVEAKTTNQTTGQKEKDYFFGQLTIVADGYASTFRKEYVGSAPIVKSKFYALELIDCQLPNPYHGTVVIGDTFPVLLYQIGTHETRALIDVPERIPEASPAAGGVRGYIRNKVLPALPPEIQPYFIAALADGRIPRSMPNSWLPPTRQKAINGLVVLGDAANMRHPLTGGGMTVAFNDVVLLSELLHPSQVPNLGDRIAVQKAMDTFYWRRKNLTAIINVLAQALYSLFAADDRQLSALRLGCFGYFQRGMGAVPTALLGGLIPRPFTLASHFFTVAFLAIWMNALAVMSGIFGILMAPLALIDGILILWKACIVFLPVLYHEIR
jgi:squalene monooxygenase